MMELLTTFGVSAKELFEYNRDYYTFDQKQRLMREMLRLEMQIKRFELFRDDIRDLVELTTSKMEMYHLVGALIMEFCVAIYTEGAEIAWVADGPPFIKALFALSLASAFNYILLAVWLSMHASVSAHSFGVRLLTRFVRLPIPGIRQVSALNARLTDFEQQGAREMLRVPFIGGAQQWKQMRPDLPQDPDEDRGEGDVRFRPAVRLEGELRPQDLLGPGEVAINEHDMCDAATKLPGHHVQLFRRLQMKWQCYDTYARVSMSLGAYHILASISYFVLIDTMRHYHSPSIAFALITVFALTTIALGVLDTGRSVTYWAILLHMFGAMPQYVAAASLSSTMGSEGDMAAYPYAWACFFLVTAWHEGLLHLAWPSDDGMSLPRRFRTVLFLDVFSVADEALRENAKEESGKDRRHRRPAHNAAATEAAAAEAEEALLSAEAALRRWQAVPAGTIEARSQGQEIARLRKQLLVSRRMLNGEFARLAGLRGDQEAIKMLDVNTKGWHDLTPEEQADDPHADSLLGPFDHASAGSAYYYDLEGREFVWQIPQGREVLTLDELDELVREADRQVRAVLAGGSDGAAREEDSDDEDSSEESSEAEEVKPQPSKPTPYRWAPQRLPWKAVLGMTRVLQAAWFFVGVMTLWQQCVDVEHRVDKYVKAEERRLAAEDSWRFQALDVAWPRGAFFQPAALACLPTGAGDLMVDSQDGLFRTSSLGWKGDSGLSAQPLQAMPKESHLPGTAAFCAPWGGGDAQDALEAANRSWQAPTRCLLGRLLGAHELLLWPAGGDPAGPTSVRLLLEGGPWQRVAGAIVPCADAAGLLPNAAAGPPPTSCLLLAGWAGGRLPVAALPLQEAQGALGLPDASATVSPAFDAPLSALRRASPEDDVLALSVEPGRGRLWVVLAGGALQAWELLGEEPRGLGRWSPAWEAGGAEAHRPVAVCEDRSGGALFVATRAPLSGPRLWRSPLIEALL